MAHSFCCRSRLAAVLTTGVVDCARHAVIFLAMVSTALAPTPLSAFSCIPSFLSDCERFWDAEAVFVGRVVWTDPRSVEDLRQRLTAALPPELARRLDQNWSAGEMRQAARYVLSAAELAALGKASDDEFVNAFERKVLMRRVRVLVTEPFRGIEDREVEFTTGFTSTSVDFQENESYLIYAWREKDTHQFQTGVCAGTRRIDQVQEQLKYIRGLKTGATQSRIFGFVTLDPQDIQYRLKVSKPLPGVPITLRSGEKTWQATTDSEGNYELTGMPSGMYDLTATLPGLPHDQRFRRIELISRECLRCNFLAVLVGSISGRLIDSERRPIRGVLVEIEAVPPTKQPHPLLQKLTDEEGRFEHTQLEAGEYLLGFNLMRPPNARDWYGKRIPYPGSYYPGVADRSAAQLLRLKSGQKMENLEFQVPPHAPQLDFAGRVAWPDGSSAEAGVSLVDLDFPPDSCQVDSVSTKADGRFSLIGLKGRHYAVLAHVGDGGQHAYSEVLELPSVNGKPIGLVLSKEATAESCEICKRFKHLWQSPLW